MKLLSLFKNGHEITKSSWPWPSCNQLKTLSFRTNDDIFKTLNSTYIETPESWFTNSSECASFSSESEVSGGGNCSIESVIQGLRSERLFFDPGETSSILEEGQGKMGKSDEFVFKESVTMCIDSHDPYGDFRKSMEEMVEAHGLKEWECLEQLLWCYLSVNGKENHDFILGAFVDLLICISFSNNSLSPSSPLSISNSSSASSSSSSTRVSSLEVEEKNDDCSSFHV